MGFLAKWHLVEIILGMILAHRNITCMDGGNSWAYRNWIGSVFFTIHIIGTSMATGLIRTVFIKSAKKTGWFSDDNLVEDPVEDEDKKTK